MNANIVTELSAAGFSIRRDGWRIVVSPASKLTPEQRVDIVASRLVLLAAHPARAKICQWDAYEADRLCSMALKKCQRVLDRADIVPWSASGVIKDRIDAAYVANDLASLRDEVAGLLVALDAILPRKLKSGVQYEPEEKAAAWTGWLRYNGSPWLPVMSGVRSRDDLSEMLFEYAKLFKACDTMILCADDEP